MSRPKCESCPVAVAAQCLGAIAAADFGYFCDWAAEGDPIEVAHVVGRSAIGLAPEPASPLQMIAGAARAAVGFVASGGATVPEDVHQARLSTCRGCEHYGGNRCDLCGCYTAIKLRLPNEACPIGKWSKEEIPG